MKNIKPWLCGAVIALGCKSPAERVISQYVSEEQCTNRLEHTLHPDADRAAFEREYGSGTCKTGSPDVDARSCSSTKVGDTCTATVGSDVACLQRTGEDEFKIDWQCSTGYNEVPVKTFKASSQDQSVVILRLRVELDDSYLGNYSGKKQSHQALGLIRPAERTPLRLRSSGIGRRRPNKVDV